MKRDRTTPIADDADRTNGNLFPVESSTTTLPAELLNLAPLQVIRTETVLSKLPIHNLSKTGSFEIQIVRKNDRGEWRFVEGDSHTHRGGEGHHHHHDEPRATVVRESPKVGRNDPCPCGSGKKYKKCCGA